MTAAFQAFSILRRLGIIVAIGFVFLFGLATTVYLSLRSPEVQVPEVVGKDRFEAERILHDAGLNYRVRATRPSAQSNPDTVLFQLPRAGEVVKVGQTVAMDISRVAKAGEASESEATDKKVAERAAENKNASNANENKPKRNKNANANKNANDNANGNGNANQVNKNANRGGTDTPNANAGNSNRAAESETTPRTSNQNTEKRPTPARETPPARNANTPAPR